MDIVEVGFVGRFKSARSPQFLGARLLPLVHPEARAAALTGIEQLSECYEASGPGTASAEVREPL